MKRFIFLIAVVFLLLSCDSPIGNLEEPATQPSSLNDTALPQTPFSLQAVQPDSVRTAAWRQFKAQHGGKWRIRWNEHTGLPRSIFGATTQKSYRGTQNRQPAPSWPSNSPCSVWVI